MAAIRSRHRAEVDKTENLNVTYQVATRQCRHLADCVEKLPNGQLETILGHNDSMMAGKVNHPFAREVWRD
jgi:hypothetical protein